MTEIELKRLRTDGGTQPRAQLDGVTVTEYADAMRRGESFPPIHVMHDGEDYWLYDGFHRVQAARQIGRETIRADVQQGTKEDAVWESLAANKDHGLRRSQADKRRAIKRALKGWGQKKSDNSIAKHVGCNHPTVSKYRKEIEATCKSYKSSKREGADGRVIDTTNIGTTSTNGERSQSGFDAKTGKGIEKMQSENHTPQPERQKAREEEKAEYYNRTEPQPFPSETEAGVIYADPPWQYRNSGLDEYGHAERHYDTMDLDALCDLPVQELAGKDCALFLWTTSPMLPDAFRVIDAWGFEYKTSFVWDKVKHNFGQYNSVRHELLLVGGRGKSKPEVSKLYDSVASIERTEHSAKPPYFRRLIETLYPSAEKVELFAREAAPGWTVWGNEVCA